MNERLIRLIRIITLIQAQPGILARELAEKCETTERTIYRDLEHLSASGIPFTNHGYGKGYSFIGNFSLYPLNWTEQEAVSFSLLPSLLQQVKDPLPPDILSAYEKVIATSYKEKAIQAELLQQMAQVIQLGAQVSSSNQHTFLSQIVDAILRNKTIDITYHTQSRNERTERLIDPYTIVPREFRFYVLAYDHQSGEMRTFRLSRFQHIEITDRTFEKNEFNLRAYLKNTWSIERGADTIRFKIRFSPNVARYVKEEELFVQPTITDLADGSIVFEVTLNHDREFLQWLYQYGTEAEILEPQHYRDKMRDMLMQWSKAYGANYVQA